MCNIFEFCLIDTYFSPSQLFNTDLVMVYLQSCITIEHQKINTTSILAELEQVIHYTKSADYLPQFPFASAIYHSPSSLSCLAILAASTLVIVPMMASYWNCSMITTDNCMSTPSCHSYSLCLANVYIYAEVQTQRLVKKIGYEQSW